MDEVLLECHTDDQLTRQCLIKNMQPYVCHVDDQLSRWHSQKTLQYKNRDLYTHACRNIPQEDKNYRSPNVKIEHAEINIHQPL